MSYLGVLIVNNIPCWDFPSLIKGCLIKVYSLKGQIDCLSEFNFWGNGERSLDFCPPLFVLKISTNKNSIFSLKKVHTACTQCTHSIYTQRILIEILNVPLECVHCVYAVCTLCVHKHG